MKFFCINLFFVIVLFFGINSLYSEPILEKNSEIKEIEKNWLKELNKIEKETTNPVNNPQSPTNPKQTLFGEGPSFIELFIRFVLILGIFGASFYFVIKYFKKKNLILNDAFAPIQVLASIPIMSGKFLQIVDVAGQIMILGISENNVSLIQIVENSIVSEKIRLWHEEYKKKQNVPPIQWNNILEKIFGKPFSFWHEDTEKQNKRDFLSYLNNQPSEVRWDDLQQLLEIQKNKLKKLKEE